jgi:O-antigen/teichoic acid export membrane protein
VNPTGARMRRLLGEGTWVAGGQIAAVLGALAGVRLLTEVLDPAAYGELMLGLTLATLVNQTILGGPLSAGAARFFAAAEQSRTLGGYRRAVGGLLAAGLAGIAVLAALAVTMLWSAGLGRWVPLTLAALAYAGVAGAVAVVAGIQNAARRRAVVAIHKGIETGGRFALGAGFVVLLGAGSAAAMIGYAVATALVLGSQLTFLGRLLPGGACEGDGAARWRGRLFAYSWPFMTWGVLTWAQLASDRWALQLFESTAALGLYAVVFQLGYYPMTLAGGVAMQFVVPFVFRLTGEGGALHRAWALNAQVALATLALTGGAVAGAAAFHAPIFNLFAAQGFREMSALLPWMVAAGGLFAAGQALSLNLMARLRTRALIGPKLATAVLAVGLNIAGARYAGVPGVVAAAVAAGLVWLVWMAALSLGQWRAGGETAPA